MSLLFFVVGWPIFFTPVKMVAQDVRYEFHANKMGTPFNIIIYGEDSARVNQAVLEAWQRIDAINEIFSDYNSTSELNTIHHHAQSGFYPVSKEFEKIMSISLIYSGLSHGAFDVTIGALTRLWRRAIKMNSYPESSKIKEALKVSGYKKIKVNTAGIKLLHGMYLDFGAIAKGYAVDEAYQVLSDHHFPIALVDGGGDIYVGSAPTGKPGWSVTMLIRDRFGQLKDSILNISQQSIVTSGDAYKFIEFEGERYSHIINPRTGKGIPGPHWTTVSAVNALHADALATTLSVLRTGQINRFKKKWSRAFPQLNNEWHYDIYRP